MAISFVPSTTPAASTAKSAAPPGTVYPSTATAELRATTAVDAATASKAAAASDTPVATPLVAPSRDQINKAMAEMKQALPPVARNLQFSVDEDTGQTVIKVIDSATKEVIRQMPSEELIAIAKALDSFKGLLVKQKV